MEEFFRLLEQLGEQAIDISVRVEEEMPVWPGDPPPRIQTVAEHSSDGYHLSRLELSAHTGTHLDAPFHFLDNAPQMPEIPQRIFFLRARVLRFQGKGPIPGDWLKEQPLGGAEAVLFRTQNSEWWRKGDRRFHRDFVALSGEAARMLADARVQLVGVDYLSVDPFESTDFPAHKALLGAGILILETIRLDRVPEGEYGLICLPLSLSVPDAAPARAMLIPPS